MNTTDCSKGDNPRDDGFKCKQCGKCCLKLFGTIQATRNDLARWNEEGREDILAWVDALVLTDECAILDFPIHPETKEEVFRCPFLRKLPRQMRYICRINDTKPDACTRFPVSREHAEKEGCPGYEAVFDVQAGMP